MSRLTIGAPETLDENQRELYDAITHGPRAAGPQHFALLDQQGVLNGPFNAFLLSPGLGQAIQALGARIRYASSLGDRTRELSILTVAAHWHSEFEWHAHEAVGRSLGLDHEIELVREGRVEELTNPEERNAVMAVRMLLEGGDLTDDQYAELVGSLGEAPLFELSTLVGYYSMLALQLRVFGVTA